MPNTAQMLLGALVADAASLGLHWLYDPERIAQIAAARGGHSAFAPVSAAQYDGAKGVFVHGARRRGMLSQYGEVLWLALRVIAAQGGRFETAAYQAAFAGHFGPGGAYTGYIDRPTRSALERIAAGEAVSGIDDDQLPALSCLPAIVAHGLGPEALRAAQEVTNVNAPARLYGALFADLLRQVLDGAALPAALEAAVARADPEIQPPLAAALSSAEPCSVAYGEITGRACHLPMAAPLMLHILARSADYRAAVERNIRAGGDSAGRALVIGAVMAARHGVATPQGVPLDWVLTLDRGAEIWADCQAR